MRTSSMLAVVSMVGVITGCASTLQTQHTSAAEMTCPPGQVARRVPTEKGPQAGHKEPGGRAERQATGETSTEANQLNRQVVGAEQQRRNEQAAMGPRYRCEPVKAPKRTGVTNKQPEEGRTSMQPGTNEGRTSMQPTGESGFTRTVRDVAEATNPPGPYRPFAIEINPLGLFVGGRLSFNAEWSPVPHHAVELSPHFVHTTANVPVGGGQFGQEAFTGIGGEIGYRYYTGTRGMNGIFVGPSLILGAYNAGLTNGNVPFTNVGIAGDVGIQEILWNHLVLGGGLGLEYLQVSQNFGDLPTGPSTIATSGLKPRFLLEAGYGF